MPIEEQIKNVQEKYYESDFRIKKVNPRFTKTWEYLNKKNPGSLLDIGCANGVFCEPLVKKGFKCYGVDVVGIDFQQARDIGLEVKEYNFLEGLPYPDSFFDYVFAGEVIEHVTDDSYFLQECYRVLKPGGCLIITTPNLVSLGNRLLMAFGRMPRFAYNEFHYRIYNKKVLIDKIETTGFKIDKIQSSHVLISTYFNKPLGVIGEFFGDLFPTWGEQFIIFSIK